MSELDPNTVPEQQGAPAADPRDAELAELRTFREQANAAFGQLREYQPVVERLLSDQDYARRARVLIENETASQILDEGLAAYERATASRQPKLPPEWDPEHNPLLKEMGDVASYVKSLKEREAKQAEFAASEANQQIVREATSVAEGLIEQFPHLAENDHAGIRAIASFAVQNNVPFKDAADRLMPVFRGAPARAAAPPRSLRSETGAPGVPGRSTSPASDDSSNEAIRKRAIQIAASNLRGRSA
jgi:hypothetical protein